MPVKEYFEGHGEEVMEDMMKKHGKEKGKRVFYATANKKGMKPKGKKGKHGSPRGKIKAATQAEALQ